MNPLREALIRLLAAPALNVDDLEEEDTAAIEAADVALMESLATPDGERVYLYTVIGEDNRVTHIHRASLDMAKLIAKRLKARILQEQLVVVSSEIVYDYSTPQKEPEQP